ncbi:TauD/TfdA family dioxygenase [Photorhabdus temperata]|uniref:Putative taurine catabolism dioxygenase n=1 Tax=Photorhabdus temperata subsp. temperata Meg1 TaxID=1393735 RepID=A0A081RYY0_PHOTE|nr:TauD/TfdA family dioxygenase [Photorhabdus temperata]KER03883.1 putative taurine catabolism dioxygenase [Photorhabdus temperata subsp. temperata Meg1]MCT8346938.1 TauD/TfdA family dioxygenase [Photorhabdus temperata]
MLGEDRVGVRPTGWKVDDSIHARCVIQLDPAHTEELLAELSGSPVRLLNGLTTQENSGGEVGELMESVYERVKSGDGLVILKGISVAGLDENELGDSFLQLCSRMGKPVSQSVMGDIIGRVEDMTHMDPDARGYRNREELVMHTDQPDVVCMLCVRKAKQGGYSKFASALALHDAIKKSRPDLLPALYTGYPYHRLNEHPLGASEITEYNVPVFSECNGDISIRYLRFNMFAAAFARGEKIPAKLREAVDYLDELATSSAFCWITSLEEGDMVFFNNYLCLHSRTAFEDNDDSKNKRLMYRVWLECENFRSIRPELAVHPEGGGGRGGITPQVGKRPVFDYDFDWD